MVKSTPTELQQSSAVSGSLLLLSWVFLFSPQLWLEPGWPRLSESLVSAALFAPVFLWRPALVCAAWCLPWVGAAYLAYFLAVGSWPDEAFWHTLLSTHGREALEYMRSWRVRDAGRVLGWLLAAGLVAWGLTRHAKVPRQRGLRLGLWVLVGLWCLWWGLAQVKSYSLEATLRRVSRVYPISLAHALERQRLAQQGLFAVPELSAPPQQRKAELVLVVLGESASAARWSLLGYQAAATNAPLQAWEAQLLSLPVLANGNNTAQTVPVLLSGQGTDRLTPQGLATYFDWARAQGMQVRTFSNQLPLGATESFFHAAYRLRSDVFANLPGGSDDAALTPHLQRSLQELQDAPAVITLHTYGSHPEVAHRYPSAQAVWPDPYDNSVTHTSALLAQWIGLLQAHAGARPAVLLYVSDHGLNLPACGGRYTHGSARTAFEVPMLMWTNATFESAHPNWLAQARRNILARADAADLPRYDNRVFAATLADVLGYAADYPSLGSAQPPPDLLLGGLAYGPMALERPCRLR